LSFAELTHHDDGWRLESGGPWTGAIQFGSITINKGWQEYSPNWPDPDCR